MTDCERYRRLLSQQQDEPLPNDRDSGLQQHLAACDRCRKFAKDLEHQREILADLPHLATDTLTLPADSATARPNLAFRLWRARLSVPVPLAAALLAAVIGWGLLSSIDLDRSETKQIPGERKVRVLHLDPVSAVRVGQ